MAINPADYSRRVQTTVAHTFGSSQTGFVGLHTENSLPAEIFTIALNGGGDIRICTNSDGTGQLPLEVVEFDTVGSTAVLWFRMPTVDTGSSVWVFYGKAGDTQPAVTDTYGRNAVWSDYHVSSHLVSSTNEIDSSGNISDWTNTGSIGYTDSSQFGSTAVFFKHRNSVYIKRIYSAQRFNLD